ncbi:MAG: GHMP kinase, partial [Pseudonocardiaceae bacterium]
MQGVFYRDDGRRSRALVTLPFFGCGSRAVFHARSGESGAGEGGTVTVAGEGFAKVRWAAELSLRALPGALVGGHVEITSDVPRGLGLGSSTSDVTATIRAVADCLGAAPTAEEVARLAVLAEGACDSIMIEGRVVLFAHHEGTVLETLGPRLPPMVVVGCDTDPGGVVDTLGHPPARYNDWEIGAFSVLRAALRRAVTAWDVPLLARVATVSARINQRFLFKPGMDFLLAVCREEGG